MEIDPHLRHLQEQAKLFSRYNSAPGTEPGPEEAEKEPRKHSNIAVDYYSANSLAYYTCIDQKRYYE